MIVLFYAGFVMELGLYCIYSVSRTVSFTLVVLIKKISSPSPICPSPLYATGYKGVKMGGRNIEYRKVERR